MQGAMILGPAPNRSPSLQNQPNADRQVKLMAQALWGNVDGVRVKSRRYGKGMVKNGLDMKEAFALIKLIPDCKVPEDFSIHYGHRITKQAHIYFLTNQTADTRIIQPAFRVTGLQSERWEATTGDRRVLPSYRQENEATVVPLKLAPYESVFIVFRKPGTGSTTLDVKLNHPDPSMVDGLKDPWSVRFDAIQRGPEATVTFDTLMDWSRSKDDRIKYYSGTALYRNRFTLNSHSAGDPVMINLGSVTAMAKVKINGQIRSVKLAHREYVRLKGGSY